MNIRPADWLKIILLAAIFIGGVTISYIILRPPERLPVFHPRHIDPRLVDEELPVSSKTHRTQAFSLVNQNGDSITEQDVQGKIVIADFFFTTCPGICKDMAAQKRRLQEALAGDDRFVLLSHSVMPKEDSVPVLRAYAELHGALPGKWHLLTGDKRQIYRLARQSYFAILDEGGSGDETDFIHTENFVLVDPQKRIRGFYDGTSAEDVDRLINDYYRLKKEMAD